MDKTRLLADAERLSGVFIGSENSRGFFSSQPPLLALYINLGDSFIYRYIHTTALTHDDVQKPTAIVSLGAIRSLHAKIEKKNTKIGH